MVDRRRKRVEYWAASTGVAGVALYAIASVPALIVGGRWAKGVGTGGIVADDPRAIVPTQAALLRREVAELELQNDRLSRERDALVALLDDETRPR